MSRENEEANAGALHHSHHHACASLFGCGDEKGIGILREDIKERAFDNRASDRLLHMGEVDQANLDTYLSARGRWRRKFLQASSFMGALAAVGPWFGKLARAVSLVWSARPRLRPVRAACTWSPRPGKRFNSASTTPTCHPFSP